MAKTADRPLQALVDEHHAIHEALARAASLGGTTGAAAADLLQTLEGHFAKEEEMLLLLFEYVADAGGRARGSGTAGARDRAESMERSVRQAFRQHQRFPPLIDRLRDAAEREGHDRVLCLCQRIEGHMRIEEGVFFPLARSQYRAARLAEGEPVARAR
jgi:hemerythrin-like domain-containing protein